MNKKLKLLIVSLVLLGALLWFIVISPIGYNIFQVTEGKSAEKVITTTKLITKTTTIDGKLTTTFLTETATYTIDTNLPYYPDLMKF